MVTLLDIAVFFLYVDFVYAVFSFYVIALAILIYVYVFNVLLLLYIVYSFSDVMLVRMEPHLYALIREFWQSLLVAFYYIDMTIR